MTDLTMSQFASKDDLLAAQAARIAELEADLEAVGAGGVEPLRKCNKLHQIAEPAQDARTAFEAISRFMKCEWNLDWDPAGFYDDAKTDAAFTWFEQGYMRAQQAAAPQAVQDAMPKWIDDPHDIEQGQMLNPEWVKLQQADAPAHPAEGVHAQAVTYAEARECEHCNHVGINDAADGIASCTACQWNGDSPKEDKCPDCEAEGTMTASCPKCHHEYRLIADATLAATHPTQQGMDADTLLRVIQRLNQNAYSLTKSECITEVQAMREEALAAQAKQGGK